MFLVDFNKAESSLLSCGVQWWNCYAAQPGNHPLYSRVLPGWPTTDTHSLRCCNTALSLVKITGYFSFIGQYYLLLFTHNLKVWIIKQCKNMNYFGFHPSGILDCYHKIFIQCIYMNIYLLLVILLLFANKVL